MLEYIRETGQSENTSTASTQLLASSKSSLVYNGESYYTDIDVDNNSQRIVLTFYDNGVELQGLNATNGMSDCSGFYYYYPYGEYQLD